MSERFSWSLVLAGGVIAAAVTFVLLTLGAGIGLLFVHPSGPPQGLFSGGAIYFFVAEAFGFAVGGHVAGRLMGPVVESPVQEEIRAAIHGLAVWAVTVLATVVLVGVAGHALATLYGIVPEPSPRVAATVSLWTALGLLFGALVAMVSAVTARLEDDAESPWGLFAFHKKWPS